jgi:hypothetical protein
MFDVEDYTCHPPPLCCIRENVFCQYFRSLSLFWWALCFLILPWTLFWFIMWWGGILPIAENFVVALADFSIVFSLFFYEYLRRSWQNYTSGPEMYRGMLFEAHTLGINLYTAIQWTDENGTIRLNEKCAETVERIRKEIDILFYDITLVFMPHLSTVIHHPITKKKMSKDVEYSPPKVPYMHRCMESLVNIRLWVIELESSECIRGGLTQIQEGMSKLFAQLKNIDTANNVSDIDSIYWHSVVVIAIYFMVIIPYKLVITVGWLVFIFYPFLVFALVGTIFIRKYIGSPFKRYQRIKINIMETWYDEFINENNKFYNTILIKLSHKGRFELKHEDESIDMTRFTPAHEFKGAEQRTSFGMYEVMNV